MKISEGLKEGGVVVGNTYDKYNSRNPIVQWMMQGFARDLSALVTLAAPSSIHEVGCGEGYWVFKWSNNGFNARGSDFSSQVIKIAQANAAARNVSPDRFKVASIYDMDAKKDHADLVICCEVLEHLAEPELGLIALQRIVGRHLIISVPREPIWCALNIARGKYLTKLGNTPGHIQHWTQKGFIRQVSKYFEIIEVKRPFPWTMLLCQPKR